MASSLSYVRAAGHRLSHAGLCGRAQGPFRPPSFLGNIRPRSVSSAQKGESVSGRRELGSFSPSSGLGPTGCSGLGGEGRRCLRSRGHLQPSPSRWTRRHTPAWHPNSTWAQGFRGGGGTSPLALQAPQRRRKGQTPTDRASPRSACWRTAPIPDPAVKCLLCIGAADDPTEGGDRRPSPRVRDSRTPEGGRAAECRVPARAPGHPARASAPCALATTTRTSRGRPSGEGAVGPQLRGLRKWLLSRRV